MEEKVDEILKIVSKLQATVLDLQAEVSGVKTETGSLKSEVGNLKTEIASLKTRMDMVEKRLDSQGKQMADGFNTLDKKIDKTAIELRVQISNVRDELKIDIKDAIDISVRQAMMVSEHCERLYQESKKDRQELHQSVDILSNAFQFNKMEIEKLKSKC